MNNYFVILAAGKSKRFNKNIAKQFYNYKNKEIIDHSIEKSLNSNLFKKIIVVTNNLDYLKRKKYSKSIQIIKGGKERSDSSLIALKYIKKYKPKNILIHDAARPDFTVKLLKKLLMYLKNNSAVIPFIHSKDTVKYKVKNELFNLDREKTYLTQTPQAFRYKKLYKLAVQEKNRITDEATLFINNFEKVKFIKGENNNNKINSVLKKVLNSNSAEFVEVMIRNNQKIIPKLSFGDPIEDLSPKVSRKEFKSNMIIDEVEKSNIIESN